MARALSKKVRFEVFKRDSFTCQYCGRRAPEVVLEVDHINPASRGGSSDYLNLTTSCYDCNRGKGDRKLSDDSAVAKQRRQLEDLQERQEQIQMMLQWQRGLVDTESQAVGEVEGFWCELAGWFGITEDGKSDLRKMIRKHGVAAVLDAMRDATNYFKYDDDGNPTKESTEQGFNKTNGVIRTKLAEQEQPWLKDLYYTRAIVRNRCPNYFIPNEAVRILKEAYELGIPTEASREPAYACSSWSNWKARMADLMDAWVEDEELPI